MSRIAQENVRRSREALAFALRDVCRITEAARTRAAFDLSIDAGAIDALIAEAEAGLRLARERLIDTERAIDAQAIVYGVERAQERENCANDNGGGAA